MVKALILVGGFGTRLRPLTLSKPKPCVPFANLPMIVHQIAALKEAGVDEVVLAVAYQPRLMMEEMKEWEEKLNIKISYSHETEPLGTAGPLALAREILLADSDPFYVLNSDVTCTFPLKELRQFHDKHGKEGTIMVTKVEDPSKYGVVLSDRSGKIDKFVEKPTVFVGDRINAGIYMFCNSILDRIELKPTSIEKVIFPAMAADEQLFCMDLEGHWMDIGQPKDFITGLTFYLDYLSSQNSSKLLTDPEDGSFSVVGNALVAPSAKISRGCVIGPDVSIGDDCVIGEGVRLKNCSIMKGCTIGSNSLIASSIIGWDCTVGSWCRIQNTTVLGEDVQVKDELFLNGAMVLPHKGISTSVPEPEIIM